MTKETFAEIVRFGFSGGIALVIQLGILYALTSFFGLWYLLSAIVAHLFSIVVNFLLQKFYVRRNYSVDTMTTQAFSFALLAISYLIINAGLMYALVSILSWPYLIAQGLLVVLLSIGTFVVNKYFIFRSN